MTIKHQEQLVSLSAEIAENTVPESLPLFAYGKTEYTNAENKPDHYVFLEADADAIMAEFDRRGVHGMIDYNHQQLRAAKNGQPAPASGWITALEKTPAGLNARVSWTDRAKEFIANKEYRYTSPLFYKHADTNRISRFINLALTNIPGTDRQQALVALELAPSSDPSDPSDLSHSRAEGAVQTPSVVRTNPKGGNNMSNQKLFKLVGLEMPGTEDQQLVALETAISSLVDENTKLKKSVDDFKSKEESVALEAAIADGLAKGRIDNAKADKLRSKSAAEVLTILEMIPDNAAVPLGRVPEGAAEEAVALSAEDIAYCEHNGYDQAEFAKAKKGA